MVPFSPARMVQLFGESVLPSPGERNSEVDYIW